MRFTEHELTAALTGAVLVPFVGACGSDTTRKPSFIAGDFNVIPTPDDVYNPAAWVDDALPAGASDDDLVAPRGDHGRRRLRRQPDDRDPAARIRPVGRDHERDIGGVARQRQRQASARTLRNRLSMVALI